MKKVLILVNHEVTIYYFRLELVQSLLDNGYEVIISSPPGEKMDEIKEMGCKHEEIEFDRHGKNPLKEYKIYKNYKSVIQKHKPDLILTFTIKPNIYGAFSAKKYKIPHIVNITGLGKAVEKKGFLQKITLLLYKFSLNKTDKVYFQNLENYNFFKEKNIVHDNTVLIPGSGVNLDKFSYKEYPETEVVEFAFISRILKEKGIEEYLKAATVIKGKYPNTVFNIFGFHDGPYKEIVDDYHKKGIVVYHGLSDNIQDAFTDIQCTIHPTYYPEGMSNVLLETAASGRVIITTDRSGCREIVDNYKNGYLIKERNVKSLIQAIEHFLSLTRKDREIMGKYSRKKIEKEFDRNIVTNQYINDIKYLIKKDKEK